MPAMFLLGQLHDLVPVDLVVLNSAVKISSAWTAHVYLEILIASLGQKMTIEKLATKQDT